MKPTAAMKTIVTMKKFATMKTGWQQAIDSLAPRERWIIAIMAGLLIAILYAWLVYTATTARIPLRDNVALLRTQAARLDQQAQDYVHVLAAPAVTASNTDLRTLLQTRINDAGLSPALVSIDAQGANHAVVVFGAIAFADWLQWIAALASHHVALASCRIENLATPGQISVTATLMRSPPA
jgi:type II secretory pathway component PulM